MEESFEKDIATLKVFDFDGTLVDIDSTEQFFIKTAKENSQLWVLGLIFILKLVTKIRIMTVKRAKEILLNVLFDSSEEFLSNAKSYGERIHLNDIGKEIISGDKSIIVISATLEPILQAALPETITIGSKVLYQNKRFLLSTHPFREEKAHILKALVKGEEFVFYTDSKNDLPCSRLATETKWVKKGKISKINTT